MKLYQTYFIANCEVLNYPWSTFVYSRFFSTVWSCQEFCFIILFLFIYLLDQIFFSVCTLIQFLGDVLQHFQSCGCCDKKKRLLSVRDLCAMRRQQMRPDVRLANHVN